MCVDKGHVCHLCSNSRTWEKKEEEMLYERATLHTVYYTVRDIGVHGTAAQEKCRKTGFSIRLVLSVTYELCLIPT